MAGEDSNAFRGFGNRIPLKVKFVPGGWVQPLRFSLSICSFSVQKS